MERAQLDLDIEKLVYGGDALARVDGRVVLTPFVLPGERVRVRPRPGKGGTLFGADPEVLAPSSERVTPKCEYFGECGGCQYQHANYEFQLRQKVAILRETLTRIGGIAFDGEISVLSGEPWHYRNRVQLHFAQRRSGFHRAGSHDLCAIDHCPISSPTLVEAINKIAWAVKQPQWPAFLRSLELFTNEQDLQLNIVLTDRPVAARFFEWCSGFMPNLAAGAITYRAAGTDFRVSRGAFFQVNRFLIDQLVDTTLGSATGDHAVDLYAGVGLFSIPLAARFQNVAAVERSGPAFRDLEHNAAGFENIRRLNQTAEQFLREQTNAPDLVIADPPRAGLGSEAVTEILRLLPRELILVSCDPATLSRDLRKLTAAYQIERMTLADLFPQTYHFETIAWLRRQ